MAKVEQVPVEKIKVGIYEQRVKGEDEGLDGLASSIARLGLVYPLVVCPDGDEFLLIEGHRRLAACKKLGRLRVSCLVTDYGKENAAEVSFAGNFFRKDLTAVELACAINDCCKNGLRTVKELAEGFRKSEHWVRSMMAICNWPRDVLDAMHLHGLSISAAANLAAVDDDTYRAFLVRNALESGATARTTSAWLQAWRVMQPAEEAIQAEPAITGTHQTPMVPQAPCLCCSQIFPVNEMSHCPLCGACIKILRAAGTSG